MTILNGKDLSEKIKEKVQQDVMSLDMERGEKSVCLAVIQVGENAASSTYVRNKQRACEYCGIRSALYKIPTEASEEEVIGLISALNKDPIVNGILVQLPLPGHICEQRVLRAVAPEKDVDGFHVVNVGKLTVGEECFVPCTAKGIISLLRENDIEIEGKHCVVVGRSNIVGKPTAIELLHNNATVTVCHSKTKDLKRICKNADILVCAIGKPKFFDREYINEGSVVVDVGIHRQEDGTLCGDVDFDDVKDTVSAITPVPKGVGAMTVAMLMENCVKAARSQYGM